MLREGRLLCCVVLEALSFLQTEKCQKHCGHKEWKRTQLGQDILCNYILFYPDQCEAPASAAGLAAFDRVTPEDQFKGQKFVQAEGLMLQTRAKWETKTKTTGKCHFLHLAFPSGKLSLWYLIFARDWWQVDDKVQLPLQIRFTTNMTWTKTCIYRYVRSSIQPVCSDRRAVNGSWVP